VESLGGPSEVKLLGDGNEVTKVSQLHGPGGWRRRAPRT
jgi:hypothetical protein